MTQNQLRFAELQETQRHNLEDEAIKKRANKISSKHNKRADRIAQQTADTNAFKAMTESVHYERQDAANLISANASALNAETNHANYQMQHDIEYGWTGSEGYPKGMPLSAQQKNVDIILATQKYDLNNLNMDYVQAQTENVESDTKLKESNVSVNESQISLNDSVINKNVAQTGLYETQDATSILSVVFGKNGVPHALNDIWGFIN